MSALGVQLPPGSGCGVRLLCMKPAMGHKSGPLHEALSAVRAGEGLVPVVERLMSFQNRPNRKTLTALGASERFLARVDALMGDEVAPLGEPSPTLRASIGLLSRVSPPVYNESRLIRETLPAIRTGEGARVDPLMLDQARFLHERLPAFQAGEGPFFPSCVFGLGFPRLGFLDVKSPLVNHQGGFIHEALLTQRAVEHFFMRPLVGDQVDLVSEAPPTLRAFMHHGGLPDRR